MKDRADLLVRIDSTGAAHPVGRLASREMRQRQGELHLCAAPPQALVLRREEAPEALPAKARQEFWLAGEITKPGALWDLIGLIGQSNWQGELAVQVEDVRRELFFERGNVIGANSNAERERLGQVLYRYGVLSEEQVKAVAAAVTPALRFGEAAVRLGLLNKEDLFSHIGKQCEEIVYAVMLVPKGEFYFREQLEAPRLGYRLALPVTHLLMEGVRRMDETECFRARIPSSLHVPARAPNAKVAADHEHAAVFAAVDGSRSIEEIGRTVGQGEFEVTRALFQLMQAGAVVVHPPRPTGPEAIVALFNQAMSSIMREVEQVGGADDIREQLASFATASGVYDALFGAAGPAPDGTLDPARIGESAQVLIGSEGAAEMLGQWLYEYAAFAMFIAEPLLRLEDQANAARVSRHVAELLAPIAPEA